MLEPVPRCSQLMKVGVKIPDINGFPEALHVGDYEVHALFNKVILYFLFYYQSCVYIIPVGTQREKW